MTNAAYRRAAKSASASYALRAAAAMGDQFRGRDAAQISDQTQALLRRVQALGLLNSGLGLATLPTAARRPGPRGVERGRSASSIIGLVARRSAVLDEYRPALARMAGGNSARPNRLVSEQRSVAAHAARTAKAVDATPAAHTRLAGIRATASLSGFNGRHLATRLMAQGAGAALIGGRRKLPAPQGVLLAARTAKQLDASRLAVPLTATVSPARPRPRPYPEVPAAQKIGMPGFNRTVRQPGGKATAGDVYLDKALVGYHLAGAITAEQTRAAGRPSISGASFNSSMAALRPTGAGL